ncbi:MAG TPA: hypothetical protein IAC31_05075 [Candidatus Faecousia intestinigallinarum]|nr:hypothetical protein [Candidatus Faecousia intestinigallinarum]
MTLSYKARRIWRRVGIAALILLLAAVAALLVWFLWLDRFLIFSREGARLDFSLSPEVSQGQAAAAPPTEESVDVVYNEGENAVNTSTELAQLYGYYIDAQALTDLEALEEQVAAIPNGSAVMLDVKSIYGYCFYTTQSGTTADSVDVAGVDSLIAQLKSRNMYLIARMPAFQNFVFGLNNVDCGLPVEGGYLWMDGEGCYWLDPAASGTINQLVQTVAELKGLGFREVVFRQFCFPDMSSIVYDTSDLTGVLNTAAEKLVAACASSTFAVSFETELGAITMPEGRVRQYVSGVSAVNVQRTAEESGLGENAVSRLVFLSESNDTRYDAYSVLRPVNMVLSTIPQQ